MRVVLSTRSGEIRIVDAAVWGLVEAGRADELSDDIRAELADVELLVGADDDELAIMLGRSDRATAEDELLYMVVQPTAACQLGCGYCGQEHGPEQLSSADQDAFVARVERTLARGGYRRLYVGWFGAEPLLGLSVIRAMTPRLREVATAAGCTYGAKMVTNGLLLTPDTALELDRSHDVGFIEITLDGPPAFHDTRRHHKTGRASFDRIFRNLVAVAHDERVDARLSVRCNVDRANAEGVVSLIDLLASVGLAGRIDFYVALVHSWGNDAHLGSFEREEFAHLETEWLAHLILKGFNPTLVPAPKPITCLATMRDAELVDAFGSLFNCTEVSYVPSYGEPNRHRLGHVSSGVDEPERRKHFGGFNDRIRRGEFDCRECRMLPVCGGACPKSWLEGHPPCPSAKFNIETRLTFAYAAARLDDPTPNVQTIENALAALQEHLPPSLPAKRSGNPITAVPVSLGPTRSGSRVAAH